MHTSVPVRAHGERHTLLCTHTCSRPGLLGARSRRRRCRTAAKPAPAAPRPPRLLTGGGRKTPPRGLPSSSQQPPDTRRPPSFPPPVTKRPPPRLPVPTVARGNAGTTLLPPHARAGDGLFRRHLPPALCSRPARRGGYPAPARLCSRLPAARPPLARHPALPRAAEQPAGAWVVWVVRGRGGEGRPGRGEGRGCEREGVCECGGGGRGGEIK